MLPYTDLIQALEAPLTTNPLLSSDIQTMFRTAEDTIRLATAAELDAAMYRRFNTARHLYLGARNSAAGTPAPLLSVYYRIADRTAMQERISRVSNTALQNAFTAWVNPLAAEPNAVQVSQFFTNRANTLGAIPERTPVQECERQLANALSDVSYSTRLATKDANKIARFFQDQALQGWTVLKNDFIAWLNAPLASGGMEGAVPTAAQVGDFFTQRAAHLGIIPIDMRTTTQEYERQLADLLSQDPWPADLANDPSGARNAMVNLFRQNTWLPVVNEKAQSITEQQFYGVSAVGETANTTLRNAFIDWINDPVGLGGAVPTAAQVGDFFTNRANTLGAIPGRTPVQECERQLAIILSQGTNPDLFATNDVAQITNTLGHPDWLHEARNVSVRVAYSQGTIYGPGQDHNWGVNAAWAIAVTRDRRPINILSPFNLFNIERSHPNPNVPLNPSAFALEVAIAVKMDYGLNIVNDVVRLLPPPPHIALNNHLINGVPGNGILPDLQEQLDIFKQCILAQELHTHLTEVLGGANLRTYIDNIHASGNAGRIAFYVSALEILRKGDSLSPILDGMKLEQLDGLNNLLTNNPFGTNATYNNLRAEVAAARTLADTEYDFEVDTLMVDAVPDRIHGICVGIDASAKQNLVNTLAMMQRAGRINTIINNINLREHRDIRALLNAHPFDTNANCDNLRNAMRAAQLTAISTELNNILGAGAGNLRGHIFGICTGLDAVAQQDLVDALKVKCDANTVAPILNALAVFEHIQLRALLMAPPYNGNADYDGLRAAQLLAHQAAAAAALAPPPPSVLAAAPPVPPTAGYEGDGIKRRKLGD